MRTPTPSEQQTRIRIKLLVAAWAYSKALPEIMTDGEFDKLALSVDLSVATARPDLDKWFRDEFSPATGSWIGCFPEVSRIEHIYWWHYREVRTEAQARKHGLKFWVRN